MNKTEYQDLKAEMIKELYPGLEGDPEWLLRTMASDAGPESLALSLVAINGGFDECQQSLLVSLMSSDLQCRFCTYEMVFFEVIHFRDASLMSILHLLPLLPPLIQVSNTLT